MQDFNLSKAGAIAQSATAEPVTDAAAFQEIFRLMAGGRDLSVSLTLGAAGQLGGLQIRAQSTPKGPAVILYEDTDFATLTDVLPYVVPSGPWSASATEVIQFMLRAGAYQYSIWAKKAAGSDTSLDLEASAF